MGLLGFPVTSLHAGHGGLLARKALTDRRGSYKGEDLEVACTECLCHSCVLLGHFPQVSWSDPKGAFTGVRFTGSQRGCGVDRRQKALWKQVFGKPPRNGVQVTAFLMGDKAWSRCDHRE